jgi:hypothetical protein
MLALTQCLIRRGKCRRGSKSDILVGVNNIIPRDDFFVVIVLLLTVLLMADRIPVVAV